MFKKNAIAATFMFMLSNAVWAEGEKSDVAVTVANLYCDITDIIGGPIGVTIGLFIALYGFYKFLMTGAMHGLIIIFVGVMVPMFPSAYASFSEGVGAAFTGTGSGSGTATWLNDQCAGGEIQDSSQTEETEGSQDVEELKALSMDEVQQNKSDLIKNYGPLDMDYSAQN